MRALTLLAAMLFAVPGFGQAYLSGNWTPLRHEDQAERGPVPSWAIIWAFPSTTPPASAPIAGALPA